MKYDKEINVKVGIEPQYLDYKENVYKEIISKINKLLLNKEIDNIGLITKIKNIIHISGGKIQHGSAIAHFDVKLLIEIYILKIKEVINTTIRDVYSHGYYVNEPLDIFVGVEENKKMSGDKVDIEIIKIGFNKGKFLVLGKEIRR